MAIGVLRRIQQMPLGTSCSPQSSCKKRRNCLAVIYTRSRSYREQRNRAKLAMSSRGNNPQSTSDNESAQNGVRSRAPTIPSCLRSIRLHLVDMHSSPYFFHPLLTQRLITFYIAVNIPKV